MDQARIPDPDAPIVLHTPGAAGAAEYLRTYNQAGAILGVGWVLKLQAQVEFAEYLGHEHESYQ